MFHPGLAALALVGVAMPIAQQNAREIAQARAAVADMTRLAVTPDEKALADHDRHIVDRVIQLLSSRDNQARGAIGLPSSSDGQTLGTGAATSTIGTAAGGGGQGQLEAATKQMQETQMSFNLQYLQLQSQMQHENRSYTAVSNIMKAKHDTVKNSISNIR